MSAIPWLTIADYALRIGLGAMVLLRSRGTPTVRLAWLVLVFAFPLAGLVIYLLVGETRLGRSRVRRHRRLAGEISDVLRSSARPAEAELQEIPERFQRIAVLAETACGSVLRPGNALELFADTDACIGRLVQDIEGAAERCHLLFYMFVADANGTRVAEALIAAAARGAECRLLVDAVGSKRFLRSELRRRLEREGVRVVASLPANLVRMLFARIDIRNHRKIAVIDGRAAYTGSQNVADADYATKPRFAPWRDAMVRLEGPAVRDLEVLFAADWSTDAREPVAELISAKPPPAGPSTVQIMGSGPATNIRAMRYVIQTTCLSAREELILTTPYFVPDEGTLSAMCSAASSGVAVTLIVPARNDSPLVGAASRSFYATLLDAGVSIHEYTRGLLHAKTVTVDRAFGIVSTANMDRRSFEINFEASLAVYDTDFASELRMLQMSYLNDATPVHPGRWEERHWPARLWQNGAGLLSPLL